MSGTVCAWIKSEFKYYNPVAAISILIMHSYEEFMHRLNLIPSQADKILRHIRQLDKEVEELKLKL
jgi:hypothetical protein